MCTYAIRIEYIWFIDFHFESNGALKHCQVAPWFPSQGQSIQENLLCPLTHLSKCDSLIQLLPSSPTAGFTLLSRYVDTLATIHSLPQTPLQLRTSRDELIDLSKVQIVARGHHSLVLLAAPDSSFVIKISRTDCIDRERRMHSLLDNSSPYLRAMLSADAYGIVEGAGAGLSFVCLQGFGDEFTIAAIGDNSQWSRYWDQASAALKAMHGKKVLHRDIKPSNMIVIKGTLQLNDFDISCEMSSDYDLKQVRVGTEEYRSPRLQDRWRERDDWLALVLSFLSFHLPFPFADKQAALESALRLDWVPSSMKQIIENCYKK